MQPPTPHPLRWVARLNWWMHSLKGCVRYIFASLFLKQRKKIFISLQKLFLSSRKSNFRILSIQISWRHQMLKHETRNRLYWTTWEVNTICKWNLASLCYITKEKKIIKKFFKNCDWKTRPRPFCDCKKLGITSIQNDIFEARYLN